MGSPAALLHSDRGVTRFRGRMRSKHALEVEIVRRSSRNQKDVAGPRQDTDGSIAQSLGD